MSVGYMEVDRISFPTLSCLRSVAVINEPILGVAYQGCFHAVVAPNFWLQVYICSFSVPDTNECGATASGEKLDFPCMKNSLFNVNAI